MASDEHQQLANYIKEVHSALRKSSIRMGGTEAWRKHCLNTQVLMTYAESMNTLATKHWEVNCSNETSPATSRIKWCTDLCFDYFQNKSYIKYKEKEICIASKINKILEASECFSEPVRLIDVGSCYNPFKDYDFLDVLAIDLCPANDSVLKCDFLEMLIGNRTIIEDNTLRQIEENSYDVVTFCFLLEYIPTSELRIKACEKAYRILKLGGLLLINTPDSKHVGANCKLMKCWRFTLAYMGFTRIQYEKLKHMHCMAFRKCLHKDVAMRWAEIYKEPYMEYSLHIPQDFQNKDEIESNSKKIPEIKASLEDFKELPFC